MGKFHRILEPGLNILLPIVDRVKYVQSLKEIAIDVPKQSAITVDNVTLSIDGVLYLRILNPYLGKYANNIRNFFFFVNNVILKIVTYSIIWCRRSRICNYAISTNYNEIGAW